MIHLATCRMVSRIVAIAALAGAAAGCGYKGPLYLPPPPPMPDAKPPAAATEIRPDASAPKSSSKQQ
ncbi:MAG: hypothetical protein JHC61_07655 [Burkholderiaceae bacterium]|nr:hypothetical protein [Burkholderiaceae bacterium]